jgi:hypothetical protein
VTVHPDEIEFTGEHEKSYVRLWRHYCSVNIAKDGGPHLYMLSCLHSTALPDRNCTKTNPVARSAKLVSSVSGEVFHLLICLTLLGHLCARLLSYVNWHDELCRTWL